MISRKICLDSLKLVSRKICLVSLKLISLNTFTNFRLKLSLKSWQLKPISITCTLLETSSIQRGDESGWQNFGFSARMQCCTSRHILSGKTFQMLCTRSAHTFAIWSRKTEATDLVTYRRYVIFPFYSMIISQRWAQSLCTTFAKLNVSWCATLHLCTVS